MSVISSFDKLILVNLQFFTSAGGVGSVGEEVLFTVRENLQDVFNNSTLSSVLDKA